MAGVRSAEMVPSTRRTVGEIGPLTYVPFWGNPLVQDDLLAVGAGPTQ